jgi:hypothetical protein
MFELAERLVGIYKVNHMTKSVTVENRDYLGLQRQAMQAQAQAQQRLRGHLMLNGAQRPVVGVGRSALQEIPLQTQTQLGHQSSRPVSRDAVQESQSPVKLSPVHVVQGKPVANQLLVSPSQAQMQTELDASVARTEESVMDETENTIH